MLAPRPCVGFVRGETIIQKAVRRQSRLKLRQSLMPSLNLKTDNASATMSDALATMVAVLAFKGGALSC